MEGTRRWKGGEGREIILKVQKPACIKSLPVKEIGQPGLKFENVELVKKKEKKLKLFNSDPAQGQNMKGLKSVQDR